jgi:hypothetical protein
MSEKEEFIQGQIEKKNYRKTWLKKVESDSNHPINFGIHMDTHHLISAEAIKKSKLGDTLKRKGYVVDTMNNLVGFPATLPSACHLKLQLHRGDHKKIKSDVEPYHDYVASIVRGLKGNLKTCYGRTSEVES